MRILCLIPGMAPGGAQRVMAYLVSYLSQRHEVVLMTWDDPGAPSHYAISDRVQIVQAGLLGGEGLIDRAKRILARFGTIRREVRRFRPDVVLSFMDTMNIVAIIGCLGSGTPVIISERVDPAHHNIGYAKALCRRWLYPLAHCCVVQTKRVKLFFDRVPRPQLAIIPNPVPIVPQQARPGSANEAGRFRIIAVGRLDKQKGFDLLVDAFALLAPRYPCWDLIIFGEGIERPGLEAQIEQHGLADRVLLPGVTPEIWNELEESHIMALSSRYEGFPNALAEALAAGLPAVGYTGVSGVDDLIIEKKTGILVDPFGSVSALADALKSLMDDPRSRETLGAQARSHMRTWRLEVVCERWEMQLAAAAERKRC